MTDYYENKIKHLLLSSDEANIKIAFQILSHRPQLSPYLDYLFALSYYHPSEEIRQEAKTFFTPLVSPDVIHQIDMYCNAQGQITFSDYYGELRSEVAVNDELEELLKCGAVSAQGLGLMTLYWLKAGIIFCARHQVNITPQFVSEITELDLSFRLSSEVASLLVHFTNLRKLDISNNELSVLPSTLAQLTSLTKLDAAHNDLHEINLVTQLPQLQELYLGHNQLDYLPEDIHVLKQLKKLILHNNQLTLLPNTLHKLPSLQTLDVFDNCLTQLPDTLNNSVIQELYVGHNFIDIAPNYCDHYMFIQGAKRRSSHDGSWEADLLYLDEMFDGGGYDEGWFEIPDTFEENAALTLFRAENQLLNYEQATKDSFFKEVENLLLSNTLTIEDTQWLIEQLWEVGPTLAFQLGSNNDYEKVIHDLPSASFLTLSDLTVFDDYIQDLTTLATLKLHAQQSNFFTQALLDHCHDDDFVEVLYQASEISPNEWAWLNENGMHIKYLFVGEVYDY